MEGEKITGGWHSIGNYVFFISCGSVHRENISGYYVQIDISSIITYFVSVYIAFIIIVSMLYIIWKKFIKSIWCIFLVL